MEVPHLLCDTKYPLPRACQPLSDIVSTMATFETSESSSRKDPTDEQIREGLYALDIKSGEAWAILARTEMTYVQAQGDAQRGFRLEYQEGDVDEHFATTKDDLSASAIVRAFSAYRDGDDSWRGDFEFERMTL